MSKQSTILGYFSQKSSQKSNTTQSPDSSMKQNKPIIQQATKELKRKLDQTNQPENEFIKQSQVQKKRLKPNTEFQEPNQNIQPKTIGKTVDVQNSKQFNEDYYKYKYDNNIEAVQIKSGSTKVTTYTKANTDLTGLKNKNDYHQAPKQYENLKIYNPQSYQISKMDIETKQQQQKQYQQKQQKQNQYQQVDSDVTVDLGQSDDEKETIYVSRQNIQKHKNQQNNDKNSKQQQNNKIEIEKNTTKQSTNKSNINYKTNINYDNKPKSKVSLISPIKDIKDSNTKKKKSASNNQNQIQGPLEGLTIVLSGIFEGYEANRDALEDILKSLGAKLTCSISKKTSYLVHGYRLDDKREDVTQGSKYQKALLLKTTIIDLNELNQIVIKKSGKTISQIADGDIPSTITNQIQQQQQQQQQKKQEQKPNQIQQNSKNQSNQNKNDLWTQKYKPNSLEDILGNQGSIKDLKAWLLDWNLVQFQGIKKEQKFNPRTGGYDGGNVNAKAVLISGSPGIGKTTAVRLLGKELGYDIIETNASDIRNKKNVEYFLSSLRDNQLIHLDNDYQQINNKTNFFILMDEVDGMSSDRGGSKALIDIIKLTKVPIICICNDRQHPKIKTLANYCYDLKFVKPQKTSIAKRLMDILNKESIKADMNSLEYLCETMGNDIRQLLNYLEMFSKKSDQLQYFQLRQNMYQNKKDETGMLSNFDAAARLLNRSISDKLTLKDKIELFFMDYDLIPLLIQENYLSVMNKNYNSNDLEQMAKAAESIAFSDVINKSIRNNNEWNLLPQFGLFSSILPTSLLQLAVPYPKFTTWLGKFQTTRKINRELRELRVMMFESILTGTIKSLKFDYLDFITDYIISKLSNKETIQDAIEFMEQYNLNPDVLKEHLNDVKFSLSKNNIMTKIETNVKTSLTKMYNSLHKDSLVAKKKSKVNTGGGGAILNGKFDPNIDENIDDEENNLSVDEENGENGENFEENIEVIGKKTNKKSHQNSKSTKSKGDQPKQKIDKPIKANSKKNYPDY